jgi:hypothetical protein
MKTISIRALMMGAFVLLTFAGTAAGQTGASPILNTLEVRELVASTDPGDNARLAAHFTALAERYTADAKRHTAMARAFIGTPARQVGVNSASEHCKVLARLNTQSAETVRELAAHHARLTGGTSSTAPKGSGRFHGGVGAPEPSDAELTALAAEASTPADHRALAEYFLTAAKRYTAGANDHAAMAQAYRGTKIAQSAAHCERLVQLSRDEAKEANALAAEHQQLAGIAR